MVGWILGEQRKQESLCNLLPVFTLLRLPFSIQKPEIFSDKEVFPAAEL